MISVMAVSLGAGEAVALGSELDWWLDALQPLMEMKNISVVKILFISAR